MLPWRNISIRYKKIIRKYINLFLLRQGISFIPFLIKEFKIYNNGLEVIG